MPIHFSARRNRNPTLPCLHRPEQRTEERKGRRSPRASSHACVAGRGGTRSRGLEWSPPETNSKGTETVRTWSWVVAIAALLVTRTAASAATPIVSGSLADIPVGSQVNLTAEGKVDWIHWGLYTDSSLDRKAGVTPMISDFDRLDGTNGYSYIYQFGDNYNGYTWSDGNPSVAVTNTTTGVWAYGIPSVGSGFQFTVPADTTQRTLKVYVGAFNARGKLEVALSDASAPGYTNNALVNVGNGDSGIYSIDYAAGSAGQTLTIKWTLSQGMGSTPNVTLQAAALTAPGANNPPIVSISSPGENANLAAGSEIPLEANAIDADGSVALVQFYSGADKIGEASGNPFRATWSNVPAGDYLLTARATDNGGATRLSAPVEVLVSGPGGMLSGNLAFPPASVDLTAEGTSDWVHWGLVSPASVDHKAVGAQQISDFTLIGSASAQRLGDSSTGYTWSDGSPTALTNDTHTGVFVHGSTNGFWITAPADTTPRTLKVYVGLYGARAEFRAHLSDFSAPAYADASMSSVFGNYPAVYTLQYAAASAGQQVIVQFLTRELFDADYGNVTLESVTLAGGGQPTNSFPTVVITSPLDGAAFAAPATLTIVAKPFDSDGSVSQVEFFAGTNFLGNAAADPYSVTWSNVPAGSYSLTARATDNLGAATTSVPVTISVTNAVAGPVTLVNPMVSGTAFSFSFATLTGISYAVEFTDSLNPIRWTTLTNFTGDGTTLTATDTPGVAQRFYRVGSQ